MAGSKKVTVGFKYYLGAHMIFCHGPIDAVTRIMVDGRTAWSGSSTGGAININAPGLFGGEKREGGVTGQVDAAFGAPDQARNTYLQARLGANIPAFRGVFGFILRQVYIGNNPYLKRWGIIARRILKKSDGGDQWYAARAAIGQDMNPAHIIRECLTDPTWGMGYNENDMGSSFTTAADQLHAEDMGMSILWDKSMQLDEFISLILQHIDGSLYVSRDTGKFELKLSRDDYDINSLLVLDQDSISRVENFKRKTTAELTNQVTVIFWDQRTTNDNSVTVQDIALTQQQQATIGTTIQYPGFTVAEIATRVASRDLRALSVPTASCTIYANRKAASLNVGDVFKLSWPRFGITQVVMRIANIEMGSLDNNEIKIDCTEDIFALSSAIYAPPPSSEWTNPQVPPAPCPFHSVIEAPYYELAQRAGDEAAQELSATSGFVLSTGVRPSSAAFNATIWTNPGSGWEEVGTTDFCPTATIAANVTIAQTVWPIANGIDLDIVRIGSYASIGTEIVRVDALSDSSITVGRGCLDTVPVAHSAGARLMFIDDFHESDDVEYTQSEVVNTRLTPTTSLGTLDVASAATQAVTIQSRQARPYPPGRLRINGMAYPDDLIVGDFLVEWAHRDRLLQTVDVIDTETGDIGPEPGTTYTIEIRDGNTDALLFSDTGISGTSYAVTEKFSESYLGLRLWSVRDANASWQYHNFKFDYDSGGVNPIIGVTGTVNVTAENLSLAVPAGADSGDVLLAVLRCRGDRSFATPAGWSVLFSSVIPNAAGSSANTRVYIMTKNWASEVSQVFVQSTNATCAGQLFLVRGTIGNSNFVYNSGPASITKEDADSYMLGLTFDNSFPHVSPGSARIAGYAQIDYSYYQVTTTDFFASFADTKYGDAPGTVNVSTSHPGSTSDNRALWIAEIKHP